MRGGMKALSAALGLPAGADFRLKSRDPRQDLQYGESLVLCERPAPYRRALALLRGRRDAPALLARGAAECVLARFPAAVRSLTRALALDASPAEAWLFRGIARSLDCRRRKTHEGLQAALADLDQAVARGCEEALAWRAELRHDLEDMDGALSDLERMLRRKVEPVWARVERGEILCETGRHAEALREFDALVRRHPRASWARALRGRTLAVTGRERESLSDLRRAARLSPRSGAARAWLAEALRKLGRREDARAELDAAVRLEPGYAPAWGWRGRLRLDMGDARGAVSDLSRAIRLDPRYHLAFGWRGEAFRRLGRPEQAARDFARRLERARQYAQEAA